MFFTILGASLLCLSFAMFLVGDSFLVRGRMFEFACAASVASTSLVTGGLFFFG